MRARLKARQQLKALLLRHGRSYREEAATRGTETVSGPRHLLRHPTTPASGHICTTTPDFGPPKHMPPTARFDFP